MRKVDCQLVEFLSCHDFHIIFLIHPLVLAAPCSEALKQVLKRIVVGREGVYIECYGMASSSNLLLRAEQPFFEEKKGGDAAVGIDLF